MPRRRTEPERRFASVLALAALFGVSALSLASAPASGTASPGGGWGGVCNGMVLHVDVPAVGMAGTPLGITTETLVEQGCNIWQGQATINAYFVNQTTLAKQKIMTYTSPSDGSSTSQSLPSLNFGIYYVEFDATADGYQASASGSFGIIHGDCAYSGNFLFNGQAQATTFMLAPQSDCIWEVQVTYPKTDGSTGFDENVSYAGPIGGLNPQAQLSVSLPQNPFPSSVTVNVIDQFGWEDVGNGCDFGTAEHNGCTPWQAYNYADTSYPWLAFTPFTLILAIVLAVAGVAGLGLVTRIGTTNVENAQREDFRLEPG